MRIAVLAVGSRGDVQPYVALGLGLQHAGHGVRIASGANFESFVRGYGLEFVPMGGNFRQFLEADSAQRVLAKSNFIQYWRDFADALKSEFLRFAEDGWVACQEADAVIFSSLGISGYSIAQKLGIPSCWAPLQPMNRTRMFPSVSIAQRSLGGPLNYFTHLLEEEMVWQPFRSMVNQWRTQKLGLAPYPWYGANAILERNHHPMLYGYSPTVLSKPADWGDWIHVTGFWFLESPRDWRPPQDLVDFIHAGPPPVYVGFGSMSTRRPEEMTKLVLKALALSKQRAILATGWGGLAKMQIPDSVFQIDAVPHDWLFPQMAAVVHHGGAGTTAAGLAAGVPSVLVPFTVDQPFWAQRVYELGASPKPVSRQRLTAERLAYAIRQAIDDAEIRTHAAALGECIRAEDGVARAVEAFESHMRG